MSQYLYNDFVLDLSMRFAQHLDLISVEYNFDCGDEFEVAICKILRNFLPEKYGVCRGFVVAGDGEKAGDDIIIYDQSRFPTLRMLEGASYARKEKIPIEAVYAYIEAKHTLSDDSLQKAFSQVAKVKCICSKRSSYGWNQQSPYIGNCQEQNLVPHIPKIRNPVFGMIVSRYAIGVESNAENIANFLNSTISGMSRNDCHPDLVVAGACNISRPGFIENGMDNMSIFLLPGKVSGYAHNIVDNMAFGYGLTHLMSALDMISLGRMPWVSIVNDALFGDRTASITGAPLTGEGG